MASRRRNRLNWNMKRRICAAITLLSYLFACLGVPLPAAPAAKDGDQPFPCQDHPCGCRTAEQCWRSCCCFTPKQRFAWARDHQVVPPSYAEKPSGNGGWRSARKRDLQNQVPASTGSSCCHQKNPSTTTSTPSQCCEQRHDCDQRTPDCCDRSAPSKQGKSPAGSQTVRWGLGMSALSCQGLDSMPLGGPSVLPPTAPLTWNPWPLFVELLIPGDDVAFFLSLAPPVPPPRLVQA
jgi:hypothetical protein